MVEDIEIGGEVIPLGTRQVVNINVGRLYDATGLSIPVKVIRGTKPGPILFVSGAVHGDEINGVEIIRRLVRNKALRNMRGTLLAVPIVNVYGFNNRSRYFPDRRDLNRSFPGSEKGSLASRVAHVFMEEVVKKSTHGIDLHTAAMHRTNLPQIRAALSHGETKKLALAFGAPVVLNSNLKDGSLRQAALDLNIPMLLMEGGEALRFDDTTIKLGVRGVLQVMTEIEMLPPYPRSHKTAKSTYVASSSYWIRASSAGIVKSHQSLGALVKKGDLIATISDPMAKEKHHVLVPHEGVVIGQTTLPLVNQGDAMYHIATFGDAKAGAEKLDPYELTDWAYYF